MNHIPAVLPIRSHYLLTDPWVTLNLLFFCFSVQFKAFLLAFPVSPAETGVDEVGWLGGKEGKRQEREGTLNKRKGLSQKLISKEEFSALLTCFLFSFLFYRFMGFFSPPTRANTAFTPDSGFPSVWVWGGTICKQMGGGLKSSTDVFLFKLHDSIHFWCTTL